MRIYAEYIWLDGAESPSIRSKSRILNVPDDIKTEEGGFTLNVGDIPVWSFDGSSTGQAEPGNSDCVLIPCNVASNPFAGNSVIVLCHVFNQNLTAHDSDYRSKLTEYVSSNKEAIQEQQPVVGFEQEYFLFSDGKPLGWPDRGEPNPQGDYYCGNGHTRVKGRSVAERHLSLCMSSGISISGINAEVALGQWEYQIGGLPTSMIMACDHLIISRFILERVSELEEVDVNFDPKPIQYGDWNGSGLHINISTNSMRDEGGLEHIEAFCKKLSSKESVKRILSEYGEGLDRRLTGKNETSSMNEFTWGVSDRTASVRIPWSVSESKRGYLEDRRPNSNANPYRACLALVKELLDIEVKKKAPATTKKKTSAKKKASNAGE